MSGWQHTLIDEESLFLRGVNEGYRTWMLRHQKIQMIQKQLDSYSPHEQSARLEMRVQQLKAMTLGQPADPEDPVYQTVMASERRIAELAELPVSKKTRIDGNSSSDLAPGTSQNGEENSDAIWEKNVLGAYREQMHELDVKVDEVFESRYDAECELKDFEQSLLKQWQEKKQIAEYWTKRHASLTGMRSAMRTALQRYEKKNSPETHEDISMASSGDFGVCDLPMLELKETDRSMAQPNTEAIGQTYDKETLIDRDDDDDIGDASAWLGIEPLADTSLHALSDVLAEGVTDPKDREEILKREHAGSAEHPHGCRPCHFQGGLCWKGLACSFCHICPKPKRKSKHQRDVDKRRQERYKQVKDDLGIPCLDELTKIDDARRQIMTSSEELKKRVKQAYASRQVDDILEVGGMVKQMKTTVDSYHSKLPFLLIETSDAATAQAVLESDGEDNLDDFEEQSAAVVEDDLEAPDDPDDSHSKSGQTRLQIGTGVLAPTNVNKVTRRGGMNQRKNKGKSTGGDGFKGDGYKGPEYEMDRKGWHAYQPPWEKGVYAWGKKGPPPMVWGYDAKGTPQMPYPAMHSEWANYQRNSAPETGQSSFEAFGPHSGWGPPPETLQ